MPQHPEQNSYLHSNHPMVGVGKSSYVCRISQDVVIKIPSPLPFALPMLAAELRAYTAIGSHSHIAHFIGEGDIPGSILLQYYPTGTLRQYLQSMAGSSVETTYLRKIDWCFQLAKGLQHVHTAGVVHGDVSPRNILLHGIPRRLVLFDFGSSSVYGSHPVGDTYETRFRRPGSRSDRLFSADDIFAYGSTVYEIFVEIPPFNDLPDAQVTQNYENLIFPPLDSPHVLTVLAPLLDACWRARMSEIQSVISFLINDQGLAVGITPAQVAQWRTMESLPDAEGGELHGQPHTDYHSDPHDEPHTVSHGEPSNSKRHREAKLPKSQQCSPTPSQLFIAIPYGD